MSSEGEDGGPRSGGARSLLEKGHTRAGGPGTSPWGAPKAPSSPQGTSPSPFVFPVAGDTGANADHRTPASCSTSVTVLLGWSSLTGPMSSLTHREPHVGTRWQAESACGEHSSVTSAHRARSQEQGGASLLHLSPGPRPEAFPPVKRGCSRTPGGYERKESLEEI